MNNKIGLITCHKNPDLSIGDQVLIPTFKKFNIEAHSLIWDDTSINWNGYDALIIRNTWDYFEKYEIFLQWINHISDLGIPMLNSPVTILKNSHKFYLQDFEKNGIAIIPTLFSAESNPISTTEIKTKNWEKMVIKPAVSAGSFKTEIMDRTDLELIKEKLKNGDWLIQPLMPEIMENGEISMVFFNKKFSHALIKTPISGDFRVQRQYGGKDQEYYPSAALLKTAENILDQIKEDILYARVDGIMHQNQFLLMELELIEPDLFLSYGINSADKFVEESIKMLNLKP